MNDDKSCVQYGVEKIFESNLKLRRTDLESLKTILNCELQIITSKYIFQV